MECSVSNCDKSRSCRGLCASHYSRAKRNGTLDQYSLHDTISVEPQRKPPVTCSVPDCEDRHFGRGLCRKHHYRQIIRRPRPAHVRRPFDLDPQSDPSKCSVVDCDGSRYGRGLCTKHYVNARYHRMLDQYPKQPVRVGCSVPKCNGHHKAHGLCAKHYHRVQRTGSVELRPRPSGCREPGCEERHYSLGLCCYHYHQQRRLQRKDRPASPKPKSSRVARSRSGPKCIGPECNNPQYSHQLCKRHFRRADQSFALDLFNIGDTELEPTKPRLTPDQVREIDAAVRKARRDFMNGVITRSQLDQELESCQKKIRSFHR